MLDRKVIIEDLRGYYSEDVFQTMTSYTYDNIPEDELRKFFNTHCESHKTVVTSQELYDNYGDSCMLINSPDGFVEVGSLVQKAPKAIYTVKTATHKIKCSNDHMLETPAGWRKTEELSVGDFVLTKDGYQEIKYIRKGKTDVVYDLEVLTDQHRYWGGSGISSHNTGKTYLALSFCREAQKMGYTPIYMDSEGSIDVEFVKRLGCDVSNFIIKQVNTITEVATFIANLCEQEMALPEDARHKLILVLDSLGNLTSDKEKKTTIDGGGAKDMTKQQEVKALFRTNAIPLAKLGIPFIVNCHIYQTQEMFSKTVVSGGSGINYNSSVTILLSTAKLDDKESDKIVENKVGNYQKTGVLVSAKSHKSRFTIPQIVKFQIPFFKAPNPYVGLEAYLTWENSGILRGKLLTEKEYQKLSPADQEKCYEMTDEKGAKAYAFPKDTSRNIVVSHLHKEVELIKLWSPEVLTEQLLRNLDDSTIKPAFELPTYTSTDDLNELIGDEKE